MLPGLRSLTALGRARVIFNETWVEWNRDRWQRVARLNVWKACLLTLIGLLGLLTLSSCSATSSSVVLSSGAAGGYYHRLAEQINSSAKTVGLTVRVVIWK